MVRRFGLGNQDKVGLRRNNFLEVFDSERELVDTQHALARAKVNMSQAIANKQPSSIFLRWVNGVFEVEDDCIGPVQRRIDEVLGLVSGKIQA